MGYLVDVLCHKPHLQIGIPFHGEGTSFFFSMEKEPVSNPVSMVKESISSPVSVVKVRVSKPVSVAKEHVFKPVFMVKEEPPTAVLTEAEHQNLLQLTLSKPLKKSRSFQSNFKTYEQIHQLFYVLINGLVGVLLVLDSRLV